jgi:hypothetical protein
MAAAAAARRGLLRALVDHQAAAVNRGDAAALAGLLAAAQGLGILACPEPRRPVSRQ